MTDKKPMNEQKGYMIFKRWNQEAFKFYDRAAQYACLMEQSGEKFKHLKEEYKQKLIKMKLYEWNCQVKQNSGSLKEFNAFASDERKLKKTEETIKKFNDDFNKYYTALGFLYGSKDGYFDFIDSEKLLETRTIHEAFEDCKNDWSPLKYKLFLENGPNAIEEKPSYEESNETVSFDCSE